jgi:hypothetical protein
MDQITSQARRVLLAGRGVSDAPAGLGPAGAPIKRYRLLRAGPVGSAAATTAAAQSSPSEPARSRRSPSLFIA